MRSRVASVIILCAALIGAQAVHHKRGHQNTDPEMPHNLDCGELYDKIISLQNWKAYDEEHPEEGWDDWISQIQLENLLNLFVARCGQV